MLSILEARNSGMFSSFLSTRFSCQVSSKCEEMKYLKQQLESLTEQIRIKDLQLRTTVTFDSIKHSDVLVKLYTGCPSSEMFYSIVDKVKPHSSKL